VPVEEWLRPQKRFRHLLADPALIERIQARVDADWDALRARCGP
jgi:hypothetical protein